MEEKYSGAGGGQRAVIEITQFRDFYRILCSLGDAAKTEFIIIHSEREF